MGVGGVLEKKKWKRHGKGEGEMVDRIERRGQGERLKKERGN